MSTHHCHSLQGKVPPECIEPIWKSQGCTVAPELHLVKGLSASQLREKAHQASESSNKDEWKTCFGTSAQSGYGSKISFGQAPLPTGCRSQLNPKGDIIYCKDCGKMGGRTGEGTWLYVKGKRVWIPQCHCKSAVAIAELANDNNYNICGGNVPAPKPITETTDSCKIFQAWNDPDTKWFHQGKGIVNGVEDDHTIFFTKKGDHQVYKTKASSCRYNCNGQEISICDTGKVKSCRDDETECMQSVLTQQKSKVQPKGISAKCWYSIPINNGMGPERTYMLGKDQVKINGLDCSDSYLYNMAAVDASLYLGKEAKASATASQYANSLYLFKGDKYWRLAEVGDDFQTVSGPEGKGESISVGFPKVPYPIDGAVYNQGDQTVYFFKGDNYYVWNMNAKRLTTSGEISAKWSGVPGGIDLVISTPGSLIFFKDTFYYKAVNPMVLCPPMPVGSPWFCISCQKNGWLLEIDTNSGSWESAPGSSLKGGYLRGSPQPHQQFVYDKTSRTIINPHTGFCIGLQASMEGANGTVSMMSRIPQNDGTLPDTSNMEWGIGPATSSGRSIQCKNHILTINNQGQVSAAPLGNKNICYLTFGIPGVDWTSENWQNYQNTYLQTADKSACLQLTPIGNCNSYDKMKKDDWWITSGTMENSGVSTEDAITNVSTCSLNLVPGLPWTGASRSTWTYKNNPTGVATGYWAAPCDKNTLVCGGGDFNGSGPSQVANLGKAINQGKNSQPKGNYYIGNTDEFVKKVATPYAWKRFWGWSKVSPSKQDVCSQVTWGTCVRDCPGEYISTSAGAYSRNQCGPNSPLWRPYEEFAKNVGITISPVSIGKCANQPYQQWIFIGSRGALLNPASGFYLSCNPGTYASTTPGGAKFDSSYKMIWDEGGQRYQFVYKDGQVSSIFYDRSQTYTNVVGAVACLAKKSVDEANAIANGGGANMGFKWEKCIETTLPTWLGSDQVTLISGMPKGNPFQKPDSTHPLKGESVSSWEEADKIAKSMGTKPVTVGVLMMAYRANQGNPHFPKDISGWAGKDISYKSGTRVKISSQGNLVETNDSDCGVWVYDDASRLTYMGKAQCSSTPSPCTTDKKICQLSCQQSGNCWKNDKCYPITYTPDPTSAKPIAGLFKGVPDYLNSGFYRQGKFLAIKQNQVFVFDGKSANNQSIQNFFRNFPIPKNVYEMVQKDALKESTMDDNLYRKEREIQIRNEKLMKRGEQALALSEQVIHDQDRVTEKNTKSIDGLEKSIYSNTRQASVADDDDRKHQAKIYYLKRLLLLVVIEIIVFKLLPLIGKKGGSLGRKIAKHKKPIAIAIAVLFIVFMIPHIIGDLQMSRMRWGLKQWIQDVPGGITDARTDDKEDESHHHDHHHINKQLAQRCKSLDHSKTENTHTSKDKDKSSSGGDASFNIGMSSGDHKSHKHPDTMGASMSFGMSAGTSDSHKHLNDMEASLSLGASTHGKKTKHSNANDKGPSVGAGNHGGVDASASFSL